MSEELYYSAAEIGQHFGVNPATVRKWVREGKLERGVRFSAKCTRWPESVVLAFAASRGAGRKAKSGDCGGDSAVLKLLGERLAKARQKHPHWKGGDHFGLSVLRLELNELEHAMHYETRSRVKDEALDVAAVALRIAAGDTDIKGDAE